MATITFKLGLGGVLILPFWIAAIGVITGRVLGIRIGRWRSAVAAMIGWLMGAVAAGIVLGPKHSHALLVIPLVVFFGVLSALPVAIGIDLVTRGSPRPRARRHPLRHPVRATRSVLAPLGRFRELLGNARHENLLHVRYRSPAALASPDLARRIRVVLERSGGMFVKFGQIAATRSDMLPETLTSELSSLQSDVARVPADDIAAVMVAELGEPVEQAFGGFDYEPLAAASIGQTHRARLLDGSAVIVKVQRPGIDEIVRRDSSVLSFVSRQLDLRVEAAHRLGVRDLANELITSIKAELDYDREAEAGTRLRASRAADTGIAIPAVHPTLSSGRLLVMDEVVGRSISDAAAVDAAPIPRAELAQRLLASLLGQILEDGYYHADPHPGNVLIDSEGTLWLLDFGAVGRIDPVTREALMGIAIGFTLRDGSVIARAVRHLVGDDQSDMRQLERDLSVLIGEVEAGGISPAAMSGVMTVMDRQGLRPPRSMLLLSRTMLTLEGTLKTIDPSFELATEAERLVQRETRGDFGTSEELLRRELLHVLPALRTLPEHAEAIANQWRSGRLVMRTERYAGGDRTVVEGWLDRALVAAAGAAGVVASGVVLAAGSLSPDKGVRDALWILGFSGLTGAAIVLLRTVAQALHGQALRSER
jgi:ubiquinone biosynthesis protein